MYRAGLEVHYAHYKMGSYWMSYSLYAPYCCCTYTCFLWIVLNWAILDINKHKKLCIMYKEFVILYTLLEW